jgi:hypothetical protein
MAELIGYQTILSKALPPGVDGARLAEWALRSGRTWTQIVQDIAASLTGTNQELVSKWGWVYGLTEELMVEYPNGGSITEMPVLTDTDDPDPIRETTIAHMLPLNARGRAFGGSKRFFRDMREQQMIANVRGIVEAGRKAFERDLLNRIFSYAEVQIGSSGYSVPFVRGTGGNVDFTPPAYDGEEFTSSHSHYNGYATASYGYDDFLNALAEHIQEHGHEAGDDGYTAIVSRADIHNYYLIPDFVRPISAAVDMLDRGTTTADTGAAMFTRRPRKPGYIGYFESEYGTIEVLATSRVPAGYGAVLKSYGSVNERNPLWVRVHPDVGFGMYVVPETSGDNQWPLKKVNVEFEYGVGVGRDRTNGAVGYLSEAGAWADPVIA